MISFDNVAKRYPNGREALAGVSFNIQPGEFVFLTGRSGAGKSSVLKLIALLERPSRGTVTVAGQNTGKIKSGRIPAFRRAIGVVFQDHKLLLDRPDLRQRRAAAGGGRHAATGKWTGACAPRSTRSGC